MIIKQRDARPETFAALDRQARRTQDPLTRSACLSAGARLRADTTTEHACMLVDRQFGDAADWAVLHDLRLRIGNHAVHLNHLLVNDALECVCIDSRYLDYGLRLLPDGRCEVYSPLGSQLIASPLTKAARDARMITTLLLESGVLPRLLGIGPRANVRALVLTNPALRVGLRDLSSHGVVAVMPADALLATLWRRRLRPLAVPFERLNRKRLDLLSRHFAEAHRPIWPMPLLHERTEAA